MTNPSYSSLVAKYYDLFLKDNIDDIEFYKRYILGNYEKVLELACGTGRILLPLLECGITIEGLDNSSDMISVLKHKLQDKKRKTNIYNQSMDTFLIDSVYDLVFIGCGSFMLLNYENGLRCIDAIKNCLKPNGKILLDLFIPWDDITKKANNSFDVVRDVCVNDERCLVYEKYEIDTQHQQKIGVYKYENYINGVLERTELNDLNIRWYSEDEIRQVLQEKGFRNVRVLENDVGYVKNDTYMISAIK
jgi:SAM-dependent methyltransferase